MTGCYSITLVGEKLHLSGTLIYTSLKMKGFLTLFGGTKTTVNLGF